MIVALLGVVATWLRAEILQADARSATLGEILSLVERARDELRRRAP